MTAGSKALRSAGAGVAQPEELVSEPRGGSRDSQAQGQAGLSRSHTSRLLGREQQLGRGCSGRATDGHSRCRHRPTGREKSRTTLERDDHKRPSLPTAQPGQNRGHQGRRGDTQEATCFEGHLSQGSWEGCHQDGGRPGPRGCSQQPPGEPGLGSRGSFEGRALARGW